MTFNDVDYRGGPHRIGVRVEQYGFPADIDANVAGTGLHSLQEVIARAVQGSRSQGFGGVAGMKGIDRSAGVRRSGTIGNLPGNAASQADLEIDALPGDSCGHRQRAGSRFGVLVIVVFFIIITSPAIL